MTLEKQTFTELLDITHDYIYLFIYLGSHRFNFIIYIFWVHGWNYWIPGIKFASTNSKMYMER
jgi:hypothetical protein